MKTEDNIELKKQDRTIRKSLAFVFVPILIILIIVISIQNNSSGFLEKEYLKVNESSYSGIITNMFKERSEGRTRPILMNNKLEKYIPFYIFEKLEVGDSIVKKQHSDIELYIKKNGEIIERDINSFYRKKHFEKLNEK
jgi:ABC-type lipoprotein release transport system permease subunit